MKTLRPLLLALAAVASAGNAAAAATPGAAGTLRCGWFHNPTPANAWLVDRDGEWTVGVQGGPQSEGDWPRFRPARWVRTNGNYGYGCACLRLQVAAGDTQVQRIFSAQSRPLQACRRDRALARPE